MTQNQIPEVTGFILCLPEKQRFCLSLGHLYEGLGATVKDDLDVVAGTDQTETCIFLSAQSLARVHLRHCQQFRGSI